MFVYQIIKVLLLVSFGVTVSHLNDPLNEEGTLSRQKRAANGWTQAQQNILLEEHNKLRRGEGAMDMYQLTWHDKLAESAQALADSCVYKHDVKVVTGNEYDTMNIGQNMYMDLLVDNPAQIVGVWFAEKRDYNYVKNTCTTGRDCGHYTAVVWATTLHVGCGYKLCAKLTASDTQKWENAHFAVCNYGPGGNKKGTDGTVPVPYKAGKSCARCPSGVGWCTNGLCNAGCKAASSTCACSTVCARGAPTDPSTCKCKCPAGYVGNFCKEECVDAKPDYCGETIHAPEDDCNADVVGKTNADIAKRDCMATCHVCVALTKDNKVEDKTDLTAPKTGNGNGGGGDGDSGVDGGGGGGDGGDESSNAGQGNGGSSAGGSESGSSGGDGQSVSSGGSSAGGDKGGSSGGGNEGGSVDVGGNGGSSGGGGSSSGGTDGGSIDVGGNGGSGGGGSSSGGNGGGSGGGGGSSSGGNGGGSVDAGEKGGSSSGGSAGGSGGGGSVDVGGTGGAEGGTGVGGGIEGGSIAGGGKEGSGIDVNKGGSDKTGGDKGGSSAGTDTGGSSGTGAGGSSGTGTGGSSGTDTGGSSGTDTGGKVIDKTETSGNASTSNKTSDGGSVVVDGSDSGEEPVTTTKSTPTDGKGTGDKPTDGTGTDNKTSTGTNGTDDKTPTGTNGTDVKPTDGKDTGEKPTAATTAAPIPIEPESESDMSIIMEMDAYLSDWSKIWVNLRRLVAASTNDLCNSEPANCCGGGVNTPTTNEVYIKESDVHSAANYPKEIGTGSLEIMLYIKPSENSAACKKLGGTMSRKKRITGQAQIPQDVLLKAINQNMETIKKEMQACCNVEVKQVKAAPKTVAGRPSSLEGWEIALIVISVIGVLVVVAVMAFYMYKKHRMRKNKLNVSEKVSDRHGKSRDNPHTTVM